MKILLKMLKNNLLNCILCLMSSILVSTMLFLFDGIKNIILGTMSEAEKINSRQGIEVQTYMYILLFIGVILIVYTVSNYSRIRIRDYGMFMVLGGTKNSIIQMIFKEYGIIFGISWMIGSIIGIPLVLLVQYFFEKKGVEIDSNSFSFIKSMSVSFLYMVIIFLFAVILNLIKLHRYSLSSLLNFKERGSHIPTIKRSVVGVLVGMICFVGAGILFLKLPITYPRVKYGTFLLLCGLYLWFTYLGNLVLLFLKRQEKWYDKHMLQIKTLYYRFSENKNIILIVFIVNMFVLVIVNINIVEYSNLSSEYLWKYPYDYVCMTQQKYVSGIHEALQGTEDEMGEMKVYPYVILTSNDGGEYIGISESSYNQLTTGRGVKLEKGEVKAIFQKSEFDDEMMFQDNQVYLESGDNVVPFVIKSEEKETLFVAQQPEIIRILVMNDKDFIFMRRIQNSEDVIITQNWMENIEIDEIRLKKIENHYGVISFLKENLMKQDKQEDIITLIYYICIGIFLIISNMTILSIKVWSEVPVIGTKYSFLKKLGMDAKELIKNIKKELSICFWISFLLSFIISSIIVIYMTRGIEATITMHVMILFVFLLLIQLGYIFFIREYGCRLIMLKVYNESGRKVWK